MDDMAFDKDTFDASNERMKQLGAKPMCERCFAHLVVAIEELCPGCRDACVGLGGQVTTKSCVEAPVMPADWVEAMLIDSAGIAGAALTHLRRGARLIRMACSVGSKVRVIDVLMMLDVGMEKAADVAEGFILRYEAEKHT